MSSRSFQILFPAFFCFCLCVHETHAADQTWKQNREVMPAVTAGQSDDGKQDAFHVLDGYQVENFLTFREMILGRGYRSQLIRKVDSTHAINRKKDLFELLQPHLMGQRKQ